MLGRSRCGLPLARRRVRVARVSLFVSLRFLCVWLFTRILDAVWGEEFLLLAFTRQELRDLSVVTGPCA